MVGQNKFSCIYKILGNINENLNFEYGTGTTVSYGCAATFRGDFYYFGGAAPNKRQVRVFHWESPIWDGKLH